MCRGLRQTANSDNQALAIQSPSLVDSLSGNNFGERRSASHRRNASLGLESNFRNASSIHLQSQSQHISTDRVLYLRRGVGVRDIARIPRILKMIE